MVKGSLAKFIQESFDHAGRSRPALKKVKRNMSNGKFPKLGKKDSILVRIFYQKCVQELGIPLQPKISRRVFLKDETDFAKKFDRVVIGDYGPYLEIDPSDLVGRLTVKKGQEWRLKPNLEKRKCFPLKYEYFETHLGNMVYRQRGRVKYADYRVGKYYICPGFVDLE